MDVQTARLRMHLVESGPEDGVPVVLIHGNLSTGRFYQHHMTIDAILRQLRSQLGTEHLRSP